MAPFILTYVHCHKTRETETTETVGRSIALKRDCVDIIAQRVISVQENGR
jgi:translation initiation factor 2 beta subunit (eIF-2beta)/eIF-5